MKVSLASEEFVMDFRQQTVWTQWIALAFFFGKIGSGLFIVSLFLDTPLIAWTGLLIGNVGKAGALLIHLGRPERFWRAMARPRTSWIARTVWATGIFMVVGAIFLLLPQNSVAWSLFWVLALISAIVAAVTDGFVVNNSTGIQFWNTTMLPLLFLLYSLLGGITLFLFMMKAGWVVSMPIINLEFLEITLLVVNLAAVLIYLMSISSASAAAQESLALLTRGPYATMFYSLVIVVGFVLTILMSLVFLDSGSLLTVGITVIADLIGHFFIFYLLLMSGIYAPVLGKMSI